MALVSYRTVSFLFFSFLLVLVARQYGHFLLNFLTSNMAAGASASRIKSIDFEIFGKVQGVFFRKHTQKTAKDYHLFGWVKNTKEKTVVGQIQGPEERLKLMRNWLRNTGSPKSRIDKAVFKNEKWLDAPSYKTFSIVR